MAVTLKDMKPSNPVQMDKLRKRIKRKPIVVHVSYGECAIQSGVALELLSSMDDISTMTRYRKNKAR